MVSTIDIPFRFGPTSRSNWNLEMLVFMEGGKREYPEKNPLSKEENQQQTQPTYDTGTGNRTRATLVEDECSHHCAIPATPIPGRPWAREWRDSAEPRLRDAECREVSAAKIMEHSNSRTKCNNITCSG